MFHYGPVFAGTKLTNPILAEMEKRKKAKTLGVTRFQKPTVWNFLFHEKSDGQVQKAGPDFCFFATEKQVEITCFRRKEKKCLEERHDECDRRGGKSSNFIVKKTRI